MIKTQKPPKRQDRKKKDPAIKGDPTHNNDQQTIMPLMSAS